MQKHNYPVIELCSMKSNEEWKHICDLIENNPQYTIFYDWMGQTHGEKLELLTKTLLKIKDQRKWKRFIFKNIDFTKSMSTLFQLLSNVNISNVEFHSCEFVEYFSEENISFQCESLSMINIDNLVNFLDPEHLDDHVKNLFLHGIKGSSSLLNQVPRVKNFNSKPVLKLGKNLSKLSISQSMMRIDGSRLINIESIFIEGCFIGEELCDFFGQLSETNQNVELRLRNCYIDFPHPRNCRGKHRMTSFIFEKNVFHWEKREWNHVVKTFQLESVEKLSICTNSAMIKNQTRSLVKYIQKNKALKFLYIYFNKTHFDLKYFRFSSPINHVNDLTLFGDEHHDQISGKMIEHVLEKFPQLQNLKFLLNSDRIQCHSSKTQRKIFEHLHLKKCNLTEKKLETFEKKEIALAMFYFFPFIRE